MCCDYHSIEEEQVAIYLMVPADTVTGLAFGRISEIEKFTKENSL